MSLHRDLLSQAHHLARKEPKRPKQASLRRAVSSAYYAFFHFLIDCATRRFIRGPDRRELRDALGRAFQHAEMKDAAKSFAGGTPKAHIAPALSGNTVQLPLRDLADAFVRLQQARHDADYNRGRDFTRQETLDLVESAEKAMKDWSSIARLQADTFLISLLVSRKADR